MLYLPNEPQLSATITHTHNQHLSQFSVRAQWARFEVTWPAAISSNERQKERERDGHKNIIIINNTIKCKKLLRILRCICYSFDFASYWNLRLIDVLSHFLEQRKRLLATCHLPISSVLAFNMSCLFGYLTAASAAAGAAVAAATHCGQKDWRVEFWVSGAPTQHQPQSQELLQHRRWLANWLS